MSIFFYFGCEGMGVRNVRDDVWSGPYRGAGQEVPALSAGDREGRPYGGMVRGAVQDRRRGEGTPPYGNMARSAVKRAIGEIGEAPPVADEAR